MKCQKLFYKKIIDNFFKHLNATQGRNTTLRKVKKIVFFLHKAIYCKQARIKQGNNKSKFNLFGSNGIHYVRQHVENRQALKYVLPKVEHDSKSAIRFYKSFLIAIFFHSKC